MAIDDLFAALKKRMLDMEGTLRARINTDMQVELAGKKEVMQGKQKVDGHYFASIVKKPGDVRFYFFPIYTHVDEFPEIPEPMQKRLKGKSCFHMKKSDADELHHITDLMQKGLELYIRDGLV